MFQFGNRFSITAQKRYSIMEEEQELAQFIVIKHRSRYPKATSGFGRNESHNKTILGIHHLVERNML
jgi:hypothetical protein